MSNLAGLSLAPNSESVIKRTIDILNSVDYSKYSHSKNYEEMLSNLIARRITDLQKRIDKLVMKLYGLDTF